MDLPVSPFVVSDAPYVTALLTGLFGSVHCLGMCGGIAASLGFGLPAAAGPRLPRLAAYLLAYNAGRILTYAAGGALVGWLGGMGANLLADYQAWMALRLLAAGVMIAAGLYLAGWWFGLTRVERFGTALWRRLEPTARRLLPVQRPSQALTLGLLWGWLPCGLVYSNLIWALAAGGWRQGALFMLCFGLGTMPALIGAGVASLALNRTLRHPALRGVAGLSVIGFGAWTLIATLSHQTNVGLGCHTPSP